jgi:FkbM family methyltransferase
MTPFLELVIRRVANNCGFDLTRYRPEKTESGRLARMLQHHRVDLVLDVGANIGQFANQLRKSGYRGKILSYEPLMHAHTALLTISRDDPKWEIAPRMAIGDHEGQIEIHVSGNSVSSSLLDMLDTHAHAAPESKYVGIEITPIAKLDLVAGKQSADTNTFVKIDAQGYEDRVIDGAHEVLAKARGIQLELSLVPLYEGQQTFEPLLQRICQLGFSLWALWPGFCDPATGRMLQTDAVFFRD